MTIGGAIVVTDLVRRAPAFDAPGFDSRTLARRLRVVRIVSIGGIATVLFGAYQFWYESDYVPSQLPHNVVIEVRLEQEGPLDSGDSVGAVQGDRQGDELESIEGPGRGRLVQRRRNEPERRPARRPWWATGLGRECRRGTGDPDPDRAALRPASDDEQQRHPQRHGPLRARIVRADVPVASRPVRRIGRLRMVVRTRQIVVHIVRDLRPAGERRWPD